MIIDWSCFAQLLGEFKTLEFYDFIVLVTLSKPKCFARGGAIPCQTRRSVVGEGSNTEMIIPRISQTLITTDLFIACRDQHKNSSGRATDHYSLRLRSAIYFQQSL